MNGLGASLRYMPVALFSSVMGVAGLGLAWRAAAYNLGTPFAIGEIICLVAAVAYGALSFAYMLKAVLHWGSVKAEFRHAIAANYFPTFSISTMLLGTAAFPYVLDLARVLWMIGAAVTFVLTLVIIGRWITKPSELNHVTPAWFIPAVGNINSPVTGASLGYTEVSWMLFTAGTLFWLVLLPIIFYRLLFHDRLPRRLLPTLAILIAPPAVGFLAYFSMTGAIDATARLLFYAALFMALLVASRARVFIGLPFGPAWWAYTFPLDAVTIATLVYYAAVGAPILGAAAIVALIITTAIVALVAVRTVAALASGTLFKPDD